MNKIEFKDLPDTSTPYNAETFNLLQDNIDDAINEVHGIGTTYVSDTNPSALFGGTWEQIKTFAGGELLCFGAAYNGSSNSTAVEQNSDVSFSDSKIPSKQYSITDFIGNILSFDNGTFRVNTRGIVGMVEAIMTMSGNFNGNGALWWKGNANKLPSGVTIHNNNTGPILGNSNSMYNGASRTYFYKIDESITDNLNFYVNPIVTAYNSSFTPAGADVKCELLVKIYAKKNLTYLWKRTN